MAQIDLGKLKFTWKGTWTTQTAYEVDDVVEFDGSTFIVVFDVAANNTTLWMLLLISNICRQD